MTTTAIEDRERTAVDVLRDAAGVIESRGWCQGKASDTFGRVCAIGAIWTAATGDAYGGHQWNRSESRATEAASALSEYVAGVLAGQGFGVTGSAVSSTAGFVQPVPFWNDHICQSAEQAATMLREAAFAIEAVEAVAP
jgi:hypothetical protein